MQEIVLVVHLLLAIVMVALILLQRSEGGALGIGGGQGGFMSSRGASNVLTRTTAILAGLFMLTSVSLTMLAQRSVDSSSVIDRVEEKAAPVAPVEPALPESPQVPFAE